MYLTLQSILYVPSYLIFAILSKIIIPHEVIYMDISHYNETQDHLSLQKHIHNSHIILAATSVNNSY